MANDIIKFLKWSGVMISLVFLAGCPAPAEQTDATGTGLQPGLNLTMSISATGERTNSIPVNEDAKVDIVFLDATLAPLANELINVSATAGTLLQSTVLTDSLGKGVVTITPPELVTGTAPGTFTATPQATGEGESTIYDAVIFNYEFVATTIAETPDEAATFVSSLQFIGADPTFLSLKGTGGLGYSESSTLTFRVVDNENNPIAGVSVNFTLTTSVGGLALSGESTLSNEQGEARVTVLAGSVSTPVRVTASVVMADGSLQSVQSDVLTVTTGIPDQNSFSLAVEKFSPEGWDYDGETSIITARLADRNNNPIPDGTVVNFTTEGGRIDGSCATVNSECSVTWSSQNPRPIDGRVNILAYAIGDENFYDKDASGIFDDGDAFDDVAELFRDDDESGTFNPNASTLSQDEKLIDYNGDGVYTGPNGLYNGVPCNHSTDCPVDANNIAGRSNLLVNIGLNTVIVMASSSPKVYLYELLAGNTSCLDANNKLIVPSVRCQEVSQNFTAGPDFKDLWVLIENDKAVCKTSNGGSRVVDVNGDPVVDPNDPACIYVERLSAPTGSSVSVTTEVGSISYTPTSVESQVDALEFWFTVTADNQNVDPVTGTLELVVTTPKTNNPISASAVLTDPAN